MRTIVKTTKLGDEVYREGTSMKLHPELEKRLEKAGAFGEVEKKPTRKKRTPKKKTKEQKFTEGNDVKGGSIPDA